MPPTITLVLAGVPKGKGRPRFSKATGHVFTPEPTRSYEGALKYAAQEEMGSRLPLQGPIEVVVEARMPVPKSWSKTKQAAALAGRIRPTGKPDVDNIFKMLDALNFVVWQDDSQIVEGVASKFYHEQPSLTIKVWQRADFME
ncbi:RusA family crossover junction endodeoxyribonuclease [Methylobacterium brachiatum]|uniref:RusA family crossover junction endodeoxyribonuclease n=1 Tax=Methylobacterium brachiatum TaxID=269660 RepID=UPI000B88FAF1|nr:RusA family crossover junction endodeoxyribonuclease [Methylobacterium brachiatum]